MRSSYSAVVGVVFKKNSVRSFCNQRIHRLAVFNVWFVLCVLPLIKSSAINYYGCSHKIVIPIMSWSLVVSCHKCLRNF